MLKRCQEADLVMNWEKCPFIVQEGIVFGHKVSGMGIIVDKEKIEVIEQLPPLHQCEGNLKLLETCRILPKIYL